MALPTVLEKICGRKFEEIAERQRDMSLDELKTLSEDNIAIVSHGMIGKVMVAQLLGLSEQETLDIHQSNDLIYRVTLNSGAAEVSHFIDGDGPHPGLG